ncbi:MAG: ABC transporter ATP-binding protein [Fulvimarina sp.]|nr:ABC transporter ATP-binding protein [Fulvimarina sp.]
MALVDISDLTIGFGAEATAPPVVDGVDLSIGKGEIVALVGESGSGKSMTALSIVGLLPERGRVRAGQILFGGKDLLTFGEAALRSVRGARIGMIFQEPMTSLNPVLTIGEQLVEALIVHEKLSKAESRNRAIAMLERTGIDNAERRLRQYPHEFSGGMRQRVMIAMMMALKPALLIADEPTTALDVTIQAQILDLLREMVRDLDTSLLLITHDMGVVAEMADRVVVMRDGKVVERGDCEAIFAAPQADYTRRLLAAVPTLDDPTRETTTTSFGPEVLRLEDVSRSFGGDGFFSRQAPLKAADGVTLTVREGETLALVGESGSGKSTLGRLAMRLEKPDGGRVVVAGEDITRLSGRGLRRVRRAIQMIFQDPYASLDPRFSIGRTIAEPMIIEGGASRSEVRERVRALLERAGLSASMAGRMPHELSGGQRQRVAIARALAVSPRIIVADEPTSALDVSVQAKILDLMIELQEAEALAYLFITHDLAVVRRIAHRVAVMRKGRIVELGAAADVLERPVHPYTRSLIAAAPVPDPARRGERHHWQPEAEPQSPDMAGEWCAVGDEHWILA